MLRNQPGYIITRTWPQYLVRYLKTNICKVSDALLIYGSGSVTT